MTHIKNYTKEALSERHIRLVAETAHGEDDRETEFIVPEPLPPWAVDLDHYMSVMEERFKRSVETSIAAKQERRKELQPFEARRRAIAAKHEADWEEDRARHLRERAEAAQKGREGT